MAASTTDTIDQADQPHLGVPRRHDRGDDQPDPDDAAGGHDPHERCLERQPRTPARIITPGRSGGASRRSLRAALGVGLPLAVAPG
jgi:hypothetical protein